ncbi:hypothetical protein F6Y02_00080 [Bacillus megaterium]|nr:hypothetical protein [Priestia megaterium]
MWKTKEISKGGFRTKSEAKLAASELENKYIWANIPF